MLQKIICLCHEKTFGGIELEGSYVQKRFEPIVQEKEEEFGQTHIGQVNSGPKCLKHPFFLFSGLAGNSNYGCT